jgi:rhodanese-related sulfurtransferase
MSMVKNVDASTLDGWLRAGQALLVDVREAGFRQELIPAARSIPYSRLEPSALPARSGEQRLVLHCEIGVRSAQGAEKLLAAGLPEVFHLAGGVDAWKRAGLPVQTNPEAPPISILRQVQMTAGALVLAGAILAATVSPWFLLLAGGIGAGLFFAGASGTCAMAALLAQLPFNRRAG